MLDAPESRLQAREFGGEIDTKLLHCPVCKGPLIRKDENTLASVETGREYPIVYGIPDLRLFDPPYISREQELDRVRHLYTVFDDMDYERLVRYLETELVDQTEERREKSIEHRLALKHRAVKRLHTLLEAVSFPFPKNGGRLLDLGCGSGEVLTALGETGSDSLVGMDISLEELVLAQKLLQETGGEALLVAGCAEALPFTDNSFDFIYSSDVIEHVSDQRDYLMETYRVLMAGGHVVLNSPNRFSVVNAEPHVGIWFLGFLPRFLMDPVSRLLGKGPYVAKRLLSLRELDRLLGATFDEFSVYTRESNPDAKGLLGRLFHALNPWSVRAFARVCDQHNVLARRSAD